MPIEKSSDISKTISETVARLAHDIGADVILFITKEEEDEAVLEETFSLNVKGIIFKRNDDKMFYRFEDYNTTILKAVDGGLMPLKELLRELVVKKILNIGHKVVCVTDESIGAGYTGLIFIFEVDKVFFKVSTQKLTEGIDPLVFDSVLNIAIDIAKEGREGKKIGTAFVIGDKGNTLKHTKQMIFNPFAGYPEELRKIQDPSLKETVKEFSQLDGAFIIDKDGTILTAGAYINIADPELELAHGLGTRHRSCASITKHADDTIAIVVSESGGVIRIFKKGKVVTKLTY
ncbi:diadenylate cyclase [Candidatus Woesearchaeota archaeon]|nr:diadenylate cyclase [Candidatus Woesearchaeota archaeon]